jgi:hypothetical protein
MRLNRSRGRTVVVAAGLAALLLPGPGLVGPAFAGVPGPGPARQGTAAAQAAAPAQGSRPPVPPNFDVSQRPGNEGENTIAANPTNPRNVVAMTCPVGRKNLDGLFIGVSFDGGRTWKRRLFATGAQVGHTCDERLAWDRFGNLWMSHLTKKGDVFVGVSTDGGLHFTKVTDIVPTGPAAGSARRGDRPSERVDRNLGNVADQPFITPGPDSVWVSYASVPSGVVQAAGARVSGRGRFGSFSPPQSVPTRQGHGDASGLAIGPQGQVLVVYENIASSRRSRIYTALDPDGLGPRGFGRPRLLARTRVKFSETIPAQPDRGIDAEPKVVWDTGSGRYHGRVYAVWTQAAARNRDNLNVMFSYSGNAGRTWTKAAPLNDGQTAGSQFFQSIALDPATGDVAVGWYDCRNSKGQGGHGCARPDSYTQFWATYSTDGGTRFVRDFRVSQGTSNAKDTHSFFDYGDYTQVAFQSRLFYPAWSDNSDSTGTNPDGTLHQVDLYAARMRIP